MVWQDITVAAANALFVYSLSFQVYKGFKEQKGFIALQTSALTALGLYILTVSYFALDLYLSTLVVFISGSLWVMLAVQRIIYKRA